MSAAAASPWPNPFPGLRPFREDEEHLFFGRENQVDAMVNKLAETRFLAVVGTSGSGKSSLVNCGLRPALRQGLMSRAGTAWRMAQFRPGSDPIGALARALAQDGVLFLEQPAEGLTLAEIIETTLRMSKLGLIDIYEMAPLDEGVNLLVVVDQFEELFRYRQLEAAGRGGDKRISEEAAAFVNLLLEVKQQQTSPIFVVLTMRSDFLGDCPQFPGLAEAINAGQYLVPRMTRDERRAAIEGPVRVGGAEIAPVLLTRLVNDVGDNPDQLSILQHALNRTWARWQDEGGDKGPLDLAHYEAIGTMAHALDQHAEQAYAELGATRQQQICEKLFKALTDKATDPRGVRRPTALHTLCALADATAAEVTDVIDVFRDPSRSFLMPPAGEALGEAMVIDISHESLMRVWQRLDTWGDEEARSARTYRRLADAAALHAEGQASLWRDPDLQLALNWRDDSQPNETWAPRYHAGFAVAMRFLAQSSEAREAERAEREKQRRRELEAEQEKAQTQARYARRMRWAALSGVTLAVVAVVAGCFAMVQKQEAEISYNETLVSNLAFISNRMLVAGDFSRAIGIAKQAYEMAKGHLPPAVEQTMTDSYAQVLLAKNGLYRRIFRHELGVSYAVFSPDGSKIITTSEDGSARLWDTEGKLLAQMQHGDEVQYGAFFHDGGGIITVGYGHLVKMWDRDGNYVKDLIGHGCREEYGLCNVNQVAISPDDATIVTVSSDQKAIVWRRDGELQRVLDDHRPENGWVYHVAFSPNGKYFATSGGDWDRTVQLYDVRGQHIATLRSDACSERNHWDCAVSEVAFSPTDESLWLVAFPDRTVRQYDIEGTLHRTIETGHQGRINSIAYHPDGKGFVTSSDDGTAIVWTKDGQLKHVLNGHTGAITMARFSPNGKYIVTSSADKTAKLWDLNGNLLASYEGHEAAIRSVGFSQDSQFLVTASADKTARLWKIKPIRVPILKPGAQVAAASFLPPDGKRILTAESETDPMVLRLWGKTSGTDQGSEAYKLLKSYKGFGPDSYNNRRIYSLDISPDGKRFITTGTDYTVRIFDIESELVIHQWTDHEGCNSTDWCGPRIARYSADGRYIITGDYGGNVKIFDKEGVELKEIRAHKSYEVYGVDISPDDQYFVTSSNDKRIKLWDFKTGELLKTFPEDVGGVCCVEFSADGARILSGSADKVKLWDLNGKKLVEGEHASAVTSVEFSPTMKQILSSSEDGEAKVWDMQLNLVRTLEGHQTRVNSARFAPSGESIITASIDGTARIWLSPNEMYQWINENKDFFYPLTCDDKIKLGIPPINCDRLQ